MMKKDWGLGAREREAYCRELTTMLPQLRSRLGKTQAELGEVSGVSRVTLSQIESRRAQMNWLHLTALMLVFFENREVKEMLYASGFLDEKLMRFFQLEAQGSPVINVEVEPEKVAMLLCLEDRTA